MTQRGVWQKFLKLFGLYSHTLFLESIYYSRNFLERKFRKKLFDFFEICCSYGVIEEMLTDSRAIKKRLMWRLCYITKGYLALPLRLVLSDLTLFSSNAFCKESFDMSIPNVLRMLMFRTL